MFRLAHPHKQAMLHRPLRDRWLRDDPQRRDECQGQRPPDDLLVERQKGLRQATARNGCVRNTFVLKFHGSIFSVEQELTHS